MSSDEMRTAVAEACGWTRTKNGNGKHWNHPNINQTSTVRYNIPDYPNDLNAMHEAEKVLDREQQDKFANLIRASAPCDENGGPIDDGGPDIMYPSDFQLIHATAAQRCEAFLKAIGKYEP